MNKKVIFTSLPDLIIKPIIMPDHPDYAQNNSSDRRRFNFLLALFMIIVTGFIVFIFICADKINNNPNSKTLRKELNSITKSVDSLKNEYSTLQKKGVELESQLGLLQGQRVELINRVIDSENKLATIKKGYEKINSYTGISIDSLHSIFSARFKR